MKSLLLFVALFPAICAPAGAQCPDSLFGGGGPGFDNTNSIVMDASENLYTTGTFDSVAVFSGTQLSASPYRYGVFLNKYNAQRQPVFIKNIVLNKNGFSTPPAIARSGNYLYVFGRAQSDTTIINNVVYTSTDPSTRLFFILQTDLNGTPVWLRTFRYKDLLGTTTGFAATSDGVGNLYVGGTFTDTMTVGTSFLGSPGSFAPAIFIAKINSAGTVLWARQSASTNVNYAYLRHLHVLPGGTVVGGGSYHGSIIFGSQAAGATPSPNGPLAPFLVAYDPGGAFSWLSAATTTSTRQSASLAATSDAAGNTYTTGFFADSVDFGNGVKMYGANDLFIAKYSPAGSLLWVKKKDGHASATNIEAGTGIAISHAIRLIITGVFTDSTYFGTDKALSVGAQDFFIAEYDSNGALHRANSYGSTGNDEADCPLVHANDSILVCGTFIGPVLNVNGHSLSKNGVLGGDVFWYDRCAGNSLGVLPAGRSAQPLIVYPNPARDEVHVSFTQAGTGPVSLDVYDMTGRIVWTSFYPTGTPSAKLNIGAWPAGAYLIRLLVNGDAYRQVLVKE